MIRGGGGEQRLPGLDATPRQPNPPSLAPSAASCCMAAHTGHPESASSTARASGCIAPASPSYFLPFLPLPLPRAFGFSAAFCAFTERYSLNPFWMRRAAVFRFASS